MSCEVPSPHIHRWESPHSTLVKVLIHDIIDIAAQSWGTLHIISSTPTEIPALVVSFLFFSCMVE